MVFPEPMGKPGPVEDFPNAAKMSEARSKKACRISGYWRARISILGLDPNPCATETQRRRDAKICPSLKGKLAGPCKKAATSSMFGLTSMSMLLLSRQVSNLRSILVIENCALRQSHHLSIPVITVGSDTPQPHHFGPLHLLLRQR